MPGFYVIYAPRAWSVIDHVQVTSGHSALGLREKKEIP